jgi:hypothetical protein
MPRPPLATLLPDSIEPYLALMFAGFLVAIYGQALRLRWLVVAGVVMVFLATVGFPIAVNLLNQSPGPPGPLIGEP